MVVTFGKRIRSDKPIYKGDNYFLYKLTEEGIENFKKDGIKTNTIIHFGVLPFCIFHLLTTSSKFFIPIYILGGTINLYCVILQRYNTIRLNRVYEKIKAREKRKNKNSELKQELGNDLNIKKCNSEIESLKTIKSKLVEQHSLIEEKEEENYKIKKLIK
ncbi:MAG: hypothetical protein PHW32_01350 [Bacilli bacterium]|nr:hypothetical protein [Bacilli bacterium]